MPRVEYVSLSGEKLPGCSDVAKIVELERGKTEGLLRWAEGLARRGVDRKSSNMAAMGRGTLSHYMIDQFIWGAEPEDGLPTAEDLGISETARESAIIAARDAYSFFAAWWSCSGMTPVVSELSMVSDLHRYGGTPDVVAEDANGDVWIIDWKNCGQLGESHYLQCAGYCVLWETGRKNSIQEGVRHESMELPKDRALMGYILVRERDGKPEVRRHRLTEEGAHYLDVYKLAIRLADLVARKPRKVAMTEQDKDIIKAWKESKGYKW